MVILNNQIAQKLRRRIIYSFSDLLILTKLQNSLPMSCDEIIRLIQRKFGVMISPGTLYAHLYSLEQNRLLTGYFSRKKYARAQKLYKITEEGKQSIRRIIKHQNVLQETIVEILKA